MWGDLMIMNPGNFKEKLIIQKLEVINNMGDIEEEWTDFCIVHAYINGLSGDELYEARKINQENSLKVLIRYAKALECLNPQDYRVVFRGQPYKILPPIDNFQMLNQTIKFSIISYDVGDKNVSE